MGLPDRTSTTSKTWANVPHIINRGADWYAGIGTENSKGTKVFSLVGKVNNTGLVEVPMGITLRELIYDIGGGIADGGQFKAVQTGGPSGGCLPAVLLDLPVDFDEPDRGRLHDGLGRHDRHGRAHLHGRRGALLHGLPAWTNRAASARPAARASAQMHADPGAASARARGQESDLDAAARICVTSLRRARCARWARPRPTRS